MLEISVCYDVLDSPVEIEIFDTSIEQIIGQLSLQKEFLTLNIKVKDTKTQYKGWQVFDYLYDKFISLNIHFKGIRGQWGSGRIYCDNTIAFNKYVLTLPLHEAIFKTWTGQQAFRKGYCHTKVEKMQAHFNPPPEYAPVEVLFFKQP